MKATLIFFLFSISVYAQTAISGKVTDEKGEPIPGANIVIRNSYDGTSSDVNGAFVFTTEEQGLYFIDVSFIGFKAWQKQIDMHGSEIEISITMKEEINQLDAVVI